MDELNRALGDIRDIRRHVADTTEFRGYGPLTLSITAGIAVLAGVVQAVWVSQPEATPLRYAIVWSLAAVLSGGLMAVQTLTRAQRLHSAMADEMIRMAAEQFLPALLAGSLLTVVVLRSPAHIVWMLPGIWQIVYSLGIFSSCRFLPRPMLLAGGWYLLTGLLCVALGDGRALAPTMMAAAYGVGQVLIAGVLYVTAKESRDEV
jgi:hypothetical protein